jgi:hypothetical protein
MYINFCFLIKTNTDIEEKISDRNEIVLIFPPAKALLNENAFVSHGN